MKFKAVLEFLQTVRSSFQRSLTIRNFFQVYAGNIVATFIGLASILILIRGLRVEDYASWVAFNSIALLSSGLVGGGINLALVTFSAEYLSLTGKKPTSLYFITLLVEVLVFLVLILIGALLPLPLTELTLGNVSLSQSLQLGLLLGLGILLSQIGRGFYQAEQRYKYYIGSLWIRQGCTLLVLLGLWLTHQLNFQSAAYTSIAINLGVGMVIVLYAMLQKENFVSRDSLRRDRKQIQLFLSKMGWLVGYFIFITAIGQSDILMLSRLTNEKTVAVYGVALRYYSLALLLLDSIHTVLLPKFSEVNMQNEKIHRTFVRNWLRTTVWLFIPVLFFAFIGKRFFVWVNGPVYSEAFYILVVLSVSIWLSLMFSPLVNILISQRDFHFLFYLALCGFLVSIVGNLFLIPLFNGVGAALMVIIANQVVLHLPVLFRILRKAA